MSEARCVITRSRNTDRSGLTYGVFSDAVTFASRCSKVFRCGIVTTVIGARNEVDFAGENHNLALVKETWVARHRRITTTQHMNSLFLQTNTQVTGDYGK